MTKGDRVMVWKCPVCHGSGKYTKPCTPIDYKSEGSTRMCHGCQGKGWVNDDTLQPSLFSLPDPWPPPTTTTLPRFENTWSS